MITTSELHRAAAREGLRFDQAEKDYIILLVLSALSQILDHKGQWFFKGGTLHDSAVADACLRLFREKNFQLEVV